MKSYDHGKIEKKWQKEWDKKKTYKTDLNSKKPKQYVLDMFPYPSGVGLHVGHPRGYIGSDVYARMKRMEGFNVLHPMGYDAFGLPAEQYAVTHKIHPRQAVEKNVKTFEKQLSIIGLSYDWSRKVNTTDPEYYKWTEWIFLKIYNSWYDKTKDKARPISELVKIFAKSGNENLNAVCDSSVMKFSAKDWKNFSDLEKQSVLMQYRLAYEGHAEVNWCPELGTVLANDEVLDGPNGTLVSERGGFPVEKKSMRQWFMRITAYADRLISGLEKLDWPEHIKEIQKNWIGKDGDTYKMRDAIFARQRYWGEPIPLIHKKDGIIETVPEKKLPLELPNVKSYEPTGTGESPLAGVKVWVDKGYETNTMPGWAGSSWYFLRYIDPKNKKDFASKKMLDYWFGKKNGGVDMYVGGAEHATGHLLYARFWHKFLYDMGYVKVDEPFRALRNQGMIAGTDGRKMSKRWGNVINPDDVVKTYGADTLRVYESFMGPFDQALPWSTESIIGSRRFVEKVWRIGNKIIASQKSNLKGPRISSQSKGELGQTISSQTFAPLLHKTIKKVTEDIAGFNLNTAVSSMMICVNEMEKCESVNIKDFKTFLQILAPFAPHMTEELWYALGEKKSIHLSKWPKYDKKSVIDEKIKIAVSVNGKPRAEIFIALDMDEDLIKSMAEKSVPTWIEGKEIKKIIYVKGRIVNIVI